MIQGRKLPAHPCSQCGTTTHSLDDLCRPCKKRLRIHHYGVGLYGGHWQPNHRGVQVWVPTERKEAS